MHFKETLDFLVHICYSCLHSKRSKRCWVVADEEAAETSVNIESVSECKCTQYNLVQVSECHKSGVMYRDNHEYDEDLDGVRSEKREDATQSLAG